MANPKVFFDISAGGGMFPPSPSIAARTLLNKNL